MQIPSVAYNSWKSLYYNDPNAIEDIEKTVCSIGHFGSAYDAGALTTIRFRLRRRSCPQFQCCGWSSVTDFALPDDCETEFGFKSPCATEVQKVGHCLCSRCYRDAWMLTEAFIDNIAWLASQALEDALAPLGAMAAVIATLQVRPFARSIYEHRAPAKHGLERFSWSPVPRSC